MTTTDARSQDGDDSELPDEEVSKAALKGGRWLPAAQMVNQGSRIVTSLVLATLLTTEDFGLVAVATIVMALIDRLSNLGTGQAIIQRKGLDDRLTAAISTLNTTIGLTLGGAVIAFAVPITAVVGGSDANAASALMRVLGVNIIIQSFGVVPFALIRRRFKFEKAAIALVSGGLTYGTVSIALAIAGFGPWSLVVGTVSGTVVSVSLSTLFSGWRPRWSFDLQAIRSVASFSLGLTGTNIFNYATQNVDRSLIAHWLGVGPLGVYVLGVRVLRSPLILVTSTVNQVMVPVLSRLQDDFAGQRRHFLTVSATTMLVVAPAMLGLAVLADPLVEVALPERWAEAADLIEVMAPIGVARALWGLVSPLYVANARTGRQFVWSLIIGSLLIASYIVTARFSILAVVIGIGVVHVVASPIFFMMSFRIIELRVRDYFKAIAPAGLIAGTMAGLVYGTRVFGDSQGWSSLTQVVVGIAAGVVVYLAMVIALKPRGYESLLRLLNTKALSKNVPLFRRMARS